MQVLCSNSSADATVPKARRKLKIEPANSVRAGPLLAGGSKLRARQIPSGDAPAVRPPPAPNPSALPSQRSPAPQPGPSGSSQKATNKLKLVSGLLLRGGPGWVPRERRPCAERSRAMDKACPRLR